jgi:hypothetical protein
MSDRSRLPEIGPIKEAQRYQCGTCSHWGGDRRRFPYGWGNCAIQNREKSYHGGGECKDHSGRAKA